MGKMINMKNKKVGLLTVIDIHGKTKDRRITWRCKCDCGNEVIVSSSKLRLNTMPSCGCYTSELISNNNSIHKTKHGLSTSRIYNTYKHMIQRCENIKNEFYKDYGGRGITICSEWRNDFMVFYRWAISSGYSNNLTIDRINNNGNYEPNNCRWSNQSEQINNRRITRKIIFKGEEITYKELSERTGMSMESISYRVKAGWNIERIFNEPIRKKVE